MIGFKISASCFALAGIILGSTAGMAAAQNKVACEAGAEQACSTMYAKGTSAYNQCVKQEYFDCINGTPPGGEAQSFRKDPVQYGDVRQPSSDLLTRVRLLTDTTSKKVAVQN